MPLTDLLAHVFFEPLFEIYKTVFDVIERSGVGTGWDLIIFSIALNLVLLPVYNQMEIVSRAGAAARAEVDAQIARIKMHYTGRERYFYIRTIHRVYGHGPVSAVLGSSDLYLQVLVFATVYRFLAGHEALSGTSFYAIRDLDLPDGLLWGANLLPIIMTALNVISALLYDGGPRQRRNAFILAAVFFVLLYESPAGLVLYWTSNNAFSLLRSFLARRARRAVPPALALAFKRVREQE